MDIWKVKAAIPGLDVPFYIRSAIRPTDAQIKEVWSRTSATPLKSSKDIKGLPLRDRYPAYVGVEKLEVAEL